MGVRYFQYKSEVLSSLHGILFNLESSKGYFYAYLAIITRKKQVGFLVGFFGFFQVGIRWKNPVGFFGSGGFFQTLKTITNNGWRHHIHLLLPLISNYR